MQDLAGTTALAAGSNSGPGQADAQQPAGRGAHMMPSGPDTARGAAPAAEIRSAEVPEVRNVIVIGSGPADYTAALYAARAELKPLACRPRYLCISPGPEPEFVTIPERYGDSVDSSAPEGERVDVSRSKARR